VPPDADGDSAGSIFHSLPKEAVTEQAVADPSLLAQPSPQLVLAAQQTGS
jgi:hypothetical protein